MKAYKGKGFRVIFDIVSEKTSDDLKQIQNSQEAAILFRDTMRTFGDSVESLYAIILDVQNRPIGVHLISKGVLTQTLVNPREVFRAAIILNAAAIFIAHNHPSGDVKPSKEDRAVTKRIEEAAKLLGIQYLDHIIVGTDKYYSFNDAQEWSFPEED